MGNGKESKEKTHWLQSPNKNYLGHWDIPESGELVVTIDSAQWEGVTNPISQKTESLRVVRFKEKDVKPMICNQTNAQSILITSGIKFMEDSNGVVICLFVDKVRDRRNGEDVDCIRIKRQNPFTKERLENSFKTKRAKLKDDMKERLETIIMNDETTSYEKAIKHLDTIK